MSDIDFNEIFGKVKNKVEDAVEKAEEFVKSDEVQGFLKEAHQKAGDFTEKAKDVAIDVGGRLAEEADELSSRAKEAMQRAAEKREQAAVSEEDKDSAR